MSFRREIKREHEGRTVGREAIVRAALLFGSRTSPISTSLLAPSWRSRRRLTRYRFPTLPLVYSLQSTAISKSACQYFSVNCRNLFTKRKRVAISLASGIIILILPFWIEIGYFLHTLLQTFKFDLKNVRRKVSTVKWYCYFRIDYIVLFADFNRGKNSNISTKRRRIEASRRCTNNFSHICCVEWKRTSKNLFQRKWNKSFVSTWPSSRSSTTSWS